MLTTITLNKYEIILRPLALEDIPAITAIEARVSPSPWAATLFVDSLRVGFLGWVLILKAEIVGFGLISLAADECQILNIAIVPAWQKHKFGQALLHHMLYHASEQGARHCYLEVRQSNTIAQRLYEKSGFKPVGYRKFYYITPTGREDAIVMSSPLSQVGEEIRKN